MRLAIPPYRRVLSQTLWAEAQGEGPLRVMCKSRDDNEAEMIPDEVSRVCIYL
jgi:hypothetical protein